MVVCACALLSPKEPEYEASSLLYNNCVQSLGLQYVHIIIIYPSQSMSYVFAYYIGVGMNYLFEGTSPNLLGI